MLGGDFDEVRGVYWITDEWNGKVYQLNPDSGANIWTSVSSWIGGNSGDMWDMDVAPNGDVYVIGVVHSSQECFLLKVDPTSGTWSQVKLDRYGINGIASVPFPIAEIVNGSFEDSANMPGNSNTLNPAVDGWSGSGNLQVITNGYGWEYTDAHDGQKVLLFNAGETTPSGSIEQQVSVRNSATYLLSFWLRHDGWDSNTSPGTVGIKAELLQNGSVIAESSIYLDTAAGYNIGQWYPFSLQASSTAATMTVRFTDISTSGALRKDISIDSISMTPLDSDGDGVTDYLENRDGTDPNDSESFNPLSMGLVAYYPFDEGLNDQSGYGKDLDQLGEHEFVADLTKNYGQALRSPSRVNGGVMSSKDSGVSGNAPRTISFWFRSDGPQPWPAGNVVLLGSRVAVDRGRGSIQIDNGYRNVETPPIEFLHQRINHFVWTYQNNLGDSRFYINGHPVALVFDDRFGDPETTLEGIPDSPIKIMGGPQAIGFGDRGFQGEIDDARLYNRALSAEEVQLLYASEGSSLDSDGDGLSDVWEQGYGRYQVIQGNFNWEEAKADAEARGGHLATIISQAEQDLIVSFFESELREGRNGTWIGAYQTSKTDEPSGNWAWVNGEQWSYTNWNGAPDNHQGDQDYGCIIGDIPGFSKWDDAPLAGGYTRYLLEFGYPTDPFNADTDGDGFNDSIETHYKTDPNNASVTPNNSRPTGVVSQWVAPEANQSAVPSGLTDVVQIAAGGAGYALKTNGTIAAWGEIWSGSGSVNIPAYVPEGLANVVQVDAGINYVLALKGDGTLVTWGHFWNGNGHQAAFVPEGLSGVVQISAGISHAAALKADGTIAVWGTNNWGQLDIPVGLSDVVQVEAGGYHTMALKSDGTVVVWGGIDSRVRDVPAGLTNVVKIAAGGHVCLALKSDGTVATWGSDDLSGTDVPAGLAGVVDISASLQHASIAVKQDGTAVGWGDKSNIPVASAIIAADAGWDRNILLSAALPADTDYDGIPDNYETNTGTWVSATDTGTDPNNADTDGDGLLDGVETNTGVYVSPDDTGTNPNLADTDGDGLADGVETASFIYIDATDTGTDPNIADSDGDGLNDGAETNTGVFAGLTDTGTNPLEADTSGDGLLDGDVVSAGYNPNTSYTALFNLIKTKGTATQEVVGLFSESAMMDLNLGGVTLRRSGGTVNLRLQIQSKINLNDPQWHNEGTETFILDMPGNKAFMRIRALGPQ